MYTLKGEVVQAQTIIGMDRNIHMNTHSTQSSFWGKAQLSVCDDMRQFVKSNFSMLGGQAFIPALQEADGWVCLIFAVHHEQRQRQTLSLSRSTRKPQSHLHRHSVVLVVILNGQLMRAWLLAVGKT